MDDKRRDAIKLSLLCSACYVSTGRVLEVFAGPSEVFTSGIERFMAIGGIKPATAEKLFAQKGAIDAEKELESFLEEFLPVLEKFVPQDQ